MSTRLSLNARSITCSSATTVGDLADPQRVVVSFAWCKHYGPGLLLLGQGPETDSVKQLSLRLRGGPGRTTPCSGLNLIHLICCTPVGAGPYSRSQVLANSNTVISGLAPMRMGKVMVPVPRLT